MFSDIARRKIAMLVPLLGSDRDGEVVAAARKIQSVLANEGKDFHDLVRAVDGTPTVVYEHAWREPPKHRPKPENEWLAKAQYCADAAGTLSAREAEFINDMTVKMRLYAPSEKQAAWLEAIFTKLKRRETA